ncbi:MAG: ParB/RepB/Spo0J family partition protein [Spirochaetaceae bacterium]|nr:MAG: ParB/RepB/Spo0J family partition protein [Spirochaetaceae bacterium]
MSKRRLGKGIDALLQGRDLTQLENLSSIVNVDLDRIRPNPDQPRKHFPDESLRELADSIREKGIIQPILAEEQVDGSYVIIAGERRYRAARIAGLTEVPVISQDFSDDEKLEIALIENIQREDLNPIDEARALQRALDHSGNTQDELAKRLGKSRSAIANTLRLLRLDDRMQQAISDGKLTAGHARALLSVDDPARRTELFDRMLSDGMSVRDAELAARGELPPGVGPNGPPAPDSAAAQPESDPPIVLLTTGDDGFTAPTDDANSRRSAAPRKSIELRHIEDCLVRHLGTRVVIHGTDNAGRIEITYHRPEDLEDILKLLRVDLEG